MRRTPLLVVADPAQVSSGLLPDRHPLFQPLWTDAANARFYQGKVRRLIPATEIYNRGAFLARGLHQQQNGDGVRWLFHGTVTAAGMPSVSRWYGPAPEVIWNPGTEPVSVNDSLLQKTAQFDFTQWGDWTIFTLGMDNRGIYRYMPGSGTALLPNAPTALGVVKKQNQLMAIGTGSTRRGVHWSDADDITDWTASETNLAGRLTIEELATPIRAYARLGQNIAIYSEDQMALVFWTGAPFYYGQRVALDGIGAVGKMAVCADGRLNYGVSRNGLWRTDGQSFDYIDQGALNEYLQDNINWAQSGKIIAFRNDVTRCIEFHFPKGASLENSEAWAFDPATGGWGKVTPYQAMQERVVLDKPIAASAGSVYLLDNAPELAGALNLVTKPLTIDNAESPGIHFEARIDEIEFAALKAFNVEFRFSNANDIDGPWESTPWLPLTADMTTHRIPHLPTGVYHRLEFRNVLTNWTFDLQGFALFGQLDGVKKDAI